MDEIISIEKFKTTVAENSKKNGTWVLSQPTDVVTKFWSYDDIVKALPVDLVDDLCGFSKSNSIGYVPRFATRQKIWDDWMNNFYENKSMWCAKYGCD